MGIAQIRPYVGILWSMGVYFRNGQIFMMTSVSRQGQLREGYEIGQQNKTHLTLMKCSTMVAEAAEDEDKKQAFVIHFYPLREVKIKNHDGE